MEYITYEDYAYLMNRIAYWLISNNVKFNTRDVYNYYGRVADYGTIINTIKKRGTQYQEDGLIAEFVECTIFDNRQDTTFLPNYVTGRNGEKYYKSTYVDMANRVSAYETLNPKSPKIVYIQNPNNTTVTNPTTTTINKTYDYFIKKFGNVTDFDSALKKVQNRGYAYYYNSKYSNTTSIDRMYNRTGVNCTDSSQVFFDIATALGYTVQFVHVKCRGGDGHVRLRLKHPKNTNGEWIYRDPASVLNGSSVTSNWCNPPAYTIAYDPSWIFTDLKMKG